MRKSGTHTPRLAGLVLLLMSAPALAAPGDHIRVGEVTITPSVSTGFEFHTNVYLVDQDPTFAPDFMVAPKCTVDVDKPDYQANASLGYSMKAFIDTAPKDAANVQNLNQFNNLDGSAGFNVLRRGILGVRASDHFQITNTPAELGTAPSNANIVTTSNDLNGGILVRPGSAIEIGALGMLGLDHYQVPDAFAEVLNARNYNDRTSYGPQLDAQWKFLPKTALRGGGSVTWNNWRQNLIRAAGPEVEGLDYGDYLGKPDSIAWRTMWGVKGQWTSKISAELSVGYGQMYYDEDSVFESSQAQALDDSSVELDLTSSTDENFARDLKSFGEGSLILAQLAWVPLAKQTINVGYRKDFQDAFFTNYVVYHYIYTRYQGVVLGKLALNGEIGWRLNAFHGEVARKDSDLLVKAGGAYAFTTWFTTSAGVGWSNRSCGNAGCSGGVFESTRYDDVYGNLSVTFTY